MKAQYGLRMELKDARLGNGENAAHFFECNAFKIVESDDGSFSFGQAVNRPRQDTSAFVKFDGAGWWRGRIAQGVCHLVALSAVIADQNVLERDQRTAANGHQQAVELLFVHPERSDD